MQGSANVIEIKSSSLNHTKIRLKKPDLRQFIDQINDMALKAPKIFTRVNLILDFGHIHDKQVTTMDFDIIRRTIHESGASLIGIENPSPNQARIAKQSLIPIIQDPCIKHTSRTQQLTTVTRRVRSGAEIHAKGDLVVHGDVANGSLVSANGNIHIYGKLNGRAFFGLGESSEAHLFALTFDPELIGTPQHCMSNTHIPSSMKNRLVHCYVKADSTDIELYSHQDSNIQAITF